MSLTTPTLIVVEILVAALAAGLGYWSARRRKPVDGLDWSGLIVQCSCLFALISGLILVTTGRISVLDPSWMVGQMALLIIGIAAFQTRRIRRSQRASGQS